MTDVDQPAMLAEAREELTRADGKASILLSALGIVVGVVAAAILAGDWNPHANLNRPWEFMWWIGCALVAATGVLLGLAIYPKLFNPHPGAAVTYYNEIAQVKSVGELQKALKHVTEEQRLLKQLKAVSEIARMKYRRISLAMISLGLSLGFVLIAVFGNG